MKRRTRNPMSARAAGRARRTSPSPPTLASGAASAATIQISATRLGTGKEMAVRDVHEPFEVAQGAGRLLRRGRVDEEAAPPLEPGHIGQLRHQLDLPVIDLGTRVAGRGGVDDEVVRRVLERQAVAPQDVLQDL